MDIIVCIKQVPDTTDVRIDPKTNTLVRQGVPCIINPFDENAIEEALKLKEKYGGKVTVISMGPPQVECALRDSLAMGVDEVVLLSDRKFAGADTWATSYTLCSAIKKIAKFDVILCGKQAIDGDTAQVGPGVADQLGIPQIAYVRKIIEIADGKIKVERAFEDGYEVIESKLPILLTVLKEINVPRFPSIKGKLMAKKRQVPVWNAEQIQCDVKKIGLTGSPTQVIKIFTPQPRGAGEILKGSVEDTAKELCNRLRELKIL